MQDLQNTLQQTVQNEQILEQNIQNIQNYMTHQTTEYQTKKALKEKAL